MGKGGFGADRSFLRADRGGSAGDQSAGMGRIGVSPLGVIPDPLPPSPGPGEEEEGSRPSGSQATYAGPERVEYQGATYTGPNAEGDLARALIGQGADPAGLLVISRNGKPAIQGAIAAFAGRAWAGVEADPQFRRWRPHPEGKYPPLLVAWDAQRPSPPPRGRPGRVKAVEASARGGARGKNSTEVLSQTRASQIETSPEILPR